jgi:hypothetical protein
MRAGAVRQTRAACASSGINETPARDIEMPTRGIDDNEASSVLAVQASA